VSLERFLIIYEAEGVAIELHGVIYIADEFDNVAEFHALLLPPEDNLELSGARCVCSAS
jgi:hypothetical protein